MLPFLRFAFNCSKAKETKKTRTRQLRYKVSHFCFLSFSFRTLYLFASLCRKKECFIHFESTLNRLNIPNRLNMSTNFILIKREREKTCSQSVIILFLLEWKIKKWYLFLIIYLFYFAEFFVSVMSLLPLTKIG